MIIGNPLTLGGGGGSGFPVTVRHCGANAVVTAYNGGKTESATANADGVAVFEKLAKGVWVFANSSTQKIVEIRAKTEFGFEDTDEIIPTPMNGLIVYSAPIGTTVTATKGGENLPVSKTTIGDKELHCFIVKPQYFGEIIVACGDKVQTVTIDSNITVMLNHAVYLFKDGNQYADVTGGWSRASTSTSSGSTVTIGNTMEVKSLATAGAILAITGKKIDFANYANAKIKISSISKGSQTPNVVFEIHNTTGYSDVSASQSVSAVGTHDIPLDALSTGFVALKVHCATVIVDAVWIE